ncbi:tigger transposable element-derived protein 6-like [Rhipicephalus sanguineus]|uniref:tigger transposable element-derived protein 6-like n=1 Tax=Rhipicephalus sanguineus TaxID=34632 RepID=UPI0018961426|nr:tigger transposable element-derived protein 6-like [Rhipicephalus sanguineus]
MPPGPSNPRKRQALSLETKQSIVKDVASGMKKVSVAQKYGIADTTVSAIWKNREKVQQQLQGDAGSLARKRIRVSKYEDMDAALYKWFCEVRAQNVPVSGPMLQAKARSFATLLGIDGFNPLNGWIQRFKDRHGISYRVISGESAAVDDSAVQAWLNVNMETMLSKYAERDIYNADEAGVFYNLLPNRTVALPHERCSGRKASKERFTVLFCANMDGSDKRRLFVIGRSARPRCFKKRECLPVTYKANSKSWMTRELFANWLQKFDEDMMSEKRQVVLVLDNCSAHHVNLKLKAVSLKFLPANTTAKSQPMDQGVIAAVKAHYKRRICERLLINIQRDQPMKVHLRNAIDMVTASWWQIKPSTIAKCFAKAGFVRNTAAGDRDTTNDDDDEAVDVDDVWSDLMRNNIVGQDDTFEGFVNDDCDDIVCEQADTDEAIVAAVQDRGDEVSDDDTDEEDRTPELSSRDALDYVSKLKLFCAQNLSEKALQHIIAVEDEMVHNAVKARRQTKITAFFH